MNGAAIGHHRGMGKPPGQCDFAVVAEAVAEADDERAADAEALPGAQLRSTEASALATRIVMHATWIMFVLLFLVAVIGPHIPSGE